MRKTILIGSLIIVITLIIGIVTTTTNPAKLPVQTNTVATNEVLENFLKSNNATFEIAQAYRFALENPQNILSTVRCYCGCLKNQGHKNNRDCFFNEDGNFDLMGLNCGLCIKTALTAKQMLSEGKTVEEISNYTDSKWGKN